MVALITNNHDTKLTTPRPKLSMIWEKESDGGYQRLVARWVAVEEYPSVSNDERLLARRHNFQPLNR